MAVDVATLPLVLCGPMLRRVTTRSVSVFVALKAAAEVQIELHERTDPPAGAAPLRVSDRHPTVSLGRHLHVVVATLKVPDGSPALAAGHVYGYDLVLHDAPAAGATTRLASTGLLGGSHPLGFDAGRLPGFALAPDDLAGLQLLHGSCRKPHGEGDDMLAAVDDLLRPVRADPAARPHLLLLTGDQIYADDVAPGLLRALHDTGKALLGWTETFAGTGTSSDQLRTWLAELLAEVELILVDPAVATGHDALDALEARLQTALADPRLTGDSARAEELVRRIRRQLERYVDAAHELADLSADVFRERLLELGARILTWFEENADVFGDLSTARSWGRIATIEDATDPATAAALEGAIRAVATAGSATVQARLGELVSALDDASTGRRVLGDLARDFRRRVAELTPGAADAAVGLAGDLLEMLSTRKVEDYVASRISPPQRARELRQHARLSSGEMVAHLMFLAEFYAMYLFAFSPAAWPTETVTGDAGSAEVFRLPGAKEAVPNYGPRAAAGVQDLAKLNEAAEAFARDLPKVRRVLANVPTLMTFDDHEVSDDWNVHEQWVIDVNRSVMGPQILRSALGAYAVFQDWGNQPHDYLAGQPGRLLLDQLVPVSDGAGALSPPPTISQPDATNAMNELLGVGHKVADELPGVTAGSIAGTVTIRAPGEPRYAVVQSASTRKRWDWCYEPHPGGAVRVLALDTRTQRGFPTEQWRLRLEIESDLDVVLGGKTAAPMLIHRDELTRQLDSRLSPTATNIVVSPAPVFGLPLVEDLLQRLSALTSGSEEADLEPWQANPHGFDRLLGSLRTADTVLLSGDVHYAYTNVIQFPEADPDAPRSLCVQLTSSALRNETGQTRQLGVVGRESSLVEFVGLDHDLWERLETFEEAAVAAAAGLGEKLDELGGDLRHFGTWFAETESPFAFWDSEGLIAIWLKLKRDVLIAIDLPTPTGLVAIGNGVVAYVLGDFLGPADVARARDGEIDRGEFGMRFLADTRDGMVRRARAAALNGMTEAQVASAASRVDLRLREMDEVVGYNNVGLVDVTGDPTTSDAIRHELVWKVHGPDGKVHRPGGRPQGLLASTVYGEAHQWESFQERLAAEARRERARWHPPSGEILEAGELGLAILESYRAELRHHNARLPRDSEFWEPIMADTGAVRSWSAWFICLCMQRAGAGADFPYSSRHIDYVRRAKENAEAESENPFYLYPKDDAEAVVRVGDVVVRMDGKQYDEIDTTSIERQDGHCDICVEVSATRAICIGGNVQSDANPLSPSGITCNVRHPPRFELVGGRLGGDMLGIIRRRDVP